MSSQAIPPQAILEAAASPATTSTPAESAPFKFGYSYKEAQKLTGLSRTTLWKAVDEGKLKCFKVGRSRLFSAEHLSQFMKLYEK